MLHCNSMKNASVINTLAYCSSVRKLSRKWSVVNTAPYLKNLGKIRGQHFETPLRVVLIGFIALAWSTNYSSHLVPCSLYRFRKDKNYFTLVKRHSLFRMGRFYIFMIFKFWETDHKCVTSYLSTSGPGTINLCTTVRTPRRSKLECLSISGIPILAPCLRANLAPTQVELRFVKHFSHCTVNCFNWNI